MRWLPLLLVPFTLSCGERARDLTWYVDVPDGVGAAGQSIDVMILEGSCLEACPSGPGIYRSSVPIGADPGTPPALAPGDYAFVARIRDDSCETIACGCTSVALPTEDGDEVVVEALPGVVGGGCGDGVCVGGICQVPDASLPDTQPPMDGASCVPGQSRAEITLDNAGPAATDADVLVTFDSAALITAGTMASDCGDVGFRDAAGAALGAFLEGGCGGSDTRFWVRVPALPSGTSTMEMAHGGGPIATLPSGDWLAIETGACPEGSMTDMVGRFPIGAETHGAEGGSQTHSHAYDIRTDGPGDLTFQDGSTGATGDHKHDMMGTTADSANMPPFVEVLFCRGPDLSPSPTLLGIFVVSLPSGWTAFTSLDDQFPLGAMTPGGSGGRESHGHTVSGDTSGPDDTLSLNEDTGTSRRAASPTHGHSYSGLSNAARHIPPYLNVAFGSGSSTLAPGLVVPATSVPLAGYRRVAALDGRIPRGGTPVGETGGDPAAHTHLIDGTTNGEDDTGPRSGSGSASGRTNNSGHEHGFNADSMVGTSAPPTREVVFVERLPSAATATVGPSMPCE